MQNNNYEIHIMPLVEEMEVRSGVLDVMVPVYFHLKSSGAFKTWRKNKYARYWSKGEKEAKMVGERRKEVKSPATPSLTQPKLRCWNDAKF